MKSFIFKGDICSEEVKEIDLGAGWNSSENHWYLGLYLNQEHFTFIPNDEIFYSKDFKIQKVVRGGEVVFERVL